MSSHPHQLQRPAADTPLRPSGWHHEALLPSLARLHGVELVQVAHAPADGNDAPTGYESDVEHAKYQLGVKHFVCHGARCGRRRHIAHMLHDPGMYMGRVMYVTRESPTPRELELGGHKVFGTEQRLDDVLLQRYYHRHLHIDSNNAFPYP
ncbi:hypothetical protein B0H11DRAFT_2356620 [Mycena galericulata]|nr:hypothetical protein B0H11DRAFT_2356620 [Mycena galericulata]